MARQYDEELNADLNPGIARCELLVEADKKERKRGKRSISWADELGVSLRWQMKSIRRAQVNEHIDFKKLKSYLQLTCDLGWKHAKQTPRGKQVKALRPVTLVDSRVTIGASYKGRSPAKRINNELRRSLTHVLFTKVYGGAFYCGTKFNPADAPTRDREPEAPSCERADLISYDGDHLYDFLRRLSEAWMKEQTVRDAMLIEFES